MNVVTLVGNFVRDPELRTGKKDLAICKFTLAVRRNADETDFISCTAFGKLAEIIDQYHIKGDRIGVVGRIQTGSYENKDGDKVYTTDVIVNEIDFLKSRRDDEEEEEKSSRKKSSRR